eukprot:1225557-Amphidinium_carterae.2
MSEQEVLEPAHLMYTHLKAIHPNSQGSMWCARGHFVLTPKQRASGIERRSISIVMDWFVSVYSGEKLCAFVTWNRNVVSACSSGLAAVLQSDVIALDLGTD